MLIEKSDEKFVQYRIPGLVLSDKGTLLGYYECRRSLSDWADIDIKIIRSTDKGETFETAQIIKSGGNTLNNPVMIVDGDVIHFLYCKNYRQLFYSKSLDDGITFSNPIEITKPFENCGFYYSVLAVGPGHSVMYDGKIVAPIWFAANSEDPTAHHPSFVGTIYSENGADWQLGEIIGKDYLKEPSESALAVTKDNKLLISIRSEEVPNRAFAVSNTGYDNWQNLNYAENMPDSICQGSMYYSDGKIYHINTVTNGREDLTVKISEDNFETYKSILVDKQGGYSDIAVLDNTLYILYEHNFGEELHFIKIKVEN